MSPEFALLTDNRLSEGARVIGLWLMHQEGEDGWVEASFDALRALLYGFPSDDTIRRQLRMLRGAGWVERRPGGRGNSDHYRILDPLLSLPNTNRPATMRVYDHLDPHRAGSKATVVEREVVGSNPPVVPPAELAAPATELLEANAEVLNGCRGALKDYLHSRVTPERQRSYVGAVLSWLQGLDESVWRRADGSRVPTPERTQLLAVALNELGATDEVTARKHPPGDPRNLRNKLEGLIYGGSRRNHSPRRRGTGGEVHSELGLGSNLGEFEVEG